MVGANSGVAGCGIVPPIASRSPSSQRLVSVDELGESGVCVVEETPHGTLAVGISNGEPFAVSNRCRHLLASLGEGRIADDGCLECPWHRARFDVATGKMTRGPQGAFKPLAGAVKATTGSRSLGTFPVEIRDGVIWLAGQSEPHSPPQSIQQ